MLVLPSPTDMPARLARLLPGLVFYGLGAALMIRGGLGLGPWEVLHQGLSNHTGVPIGTVGIVVGACVLLAWIPLRQRPGLGTLLNIVVIGVVIDAALAALAAPPATALRWAFLFAGVALTAVGSGLYIGAGLGPGPRDGLMTGIAGRGFSVRSVRTGIELSVLAVGALLGGDVGIGTVVFAFGIGPLVQVFLGWLTMAPRLTAPAE